jgi:cysteinyl-tRNA synthetase
VRIQKADAVREKLKALGISEKDVADAIRWSREK